MFWVLIAYGLSNGKLGKTGGFRVKEAHHGCLARPEHGVQNGAGLHGAGQIRGVQVLGNAQQHYLRKVQEQGVWLRINFVLQMPHDDSANTSGSCTGKIFKFWTHFNYYIAAGDRRIMFVHPCLFHGINIRSTKQLSLRICIVLNINEP